MSKTMTWKQHVSEALRQVKGGQHLRFINTLYRTKEVCFVAVTYYDNEYGTRDLGCVPAGNLDYVWNNLKIRDDTIKAFEEKRKRISEPGYFDDGITCWQDFLKEFNAVDYDDYLEKKYNHMFANKLAVDAPPAKKHDLDPAISDSDVYLVISQTGVTRDVAHQALVKNNGKIIEAIMSLM